MLFAEQLFSWGLIATPELYGVVGWKLHALGWKELNWKGVDGTCQRCFCSSHLLVVCMCVCVCACVCVCLSVSVCFNKQGCMMKLKLIETSLMILVFEVTCQSYCSMCELFWFSFLFSLDPASRPTATEGWVLSFIYLVCQVIMEKLCRY